MKHYLLVVCALYSAVVVQFHIAQYADAQSGRLTPDEYGSGLGSGSDADRTTYNEMVDMALKNATVQQLFSNDVMAGGSGTEPGGSFSGSFCGLYAHLLTLEFRGCETTYLALSCSGRCHSEERPRSFTRRQDARVDPHITTCKCCSAVNFGFRRLILDLDCPDNSTLRVRHLTAFAITCGCSSCY